MRQARKVWFDLYIVTCQNFEFRASALDPYTKSDCIMIDLYIVSEKYRINCSRSFVLEFHACFN